MTTTHLVSMGVAGSGKSSVGRALHERLHWAFAEGDDFHPAANVEKMSAGVPLTDEDRWPWLDTIVDWTAEQAERGNSTVVTCSALRRSYRDRLRSAPGRTIFVHLAGTEEVIGARMAARTGHFMPPELLPSQFATLEPLEADELGVVVNVEAALPEVIEQVLDYLLTLDVEVTR